MQDSNSGHRCASSASSSSGNAKLGEVDKCSKRSSRFKLNKNGRRNFKPTSLGAKMDSNEYKLRRDDLTFSIMSYNILADELAKNHQYLYENSMESEMLRWEKRHEKLIQEIQNYDCDILCLQEVQADHFVPYFEEILQNFGYQGIYKKRTGDKKDGCAIFFKPENLTLVDKTDIEYKQTEKGCLDRDNIGILAKFRSKDHIFCVATTHLLYNPRRIDVKLAQIALMLAELDKFSKIYGASSHFPIILTGDFNCTEDSEVFQLLTRGSCSSPNFLPVQLGITDSCQHYDFVANFDKDKTRLCHSEKSEKPQILEEMDPVLFGSQVLHQSFGFKSVYNPFEKPKAVTTRQNSYVMVDYIFYSRYFSKYLSKFIESNLKLLGRTSLYTAQECTEMGHLPNDKCPSDHLCLVAKFLLTRKK